MRRHGDFRSWQVFGLPVVRFAMRAVFLLRVASQLHPLGDRASAIDAGRYQLPLRGSSGIGLLMCERASPDSL
ncbi:hypothetical protein ASD14_13360 [Lysobacter sp. Root494]|nr:hypothetical protein ASD14_13360 [Lysobacter sp. Root494]